MHYSANISLFATYMELGEVMERLAVAVDTLCDDGIYIRARTRTHIHTPIYVCVRV